MKWLIALMVLGATVSGDASQGNGPVQGGLPKVAAETKENTAAIAALAAELEALRAALPRPKPWLIVAYVNLNGEEGYQADTDNLVGGVIDSDGNGVPSTGDEIRYGSIPLSLARPEHSTWQIVGGLVRLVNPNVIIDRSGAIRGVSVYSDENFQFEIMKAIGSSRPNSFRVIHQYGGENGFIGKEVNITDYPAASCGAALDSVGTELGLVYVAPCVHDALTVDILFDL